MPDQYNQQHHPSSGSELATPVAIQDEAGVQVVNSKSPISPKENPVSNTASTLSADTENNKTTDAASRTREMRDRFKALQARAVSFFFATIDIVHMLTGK